MPIRQTMFPMHCFLCASDRHCFVGTDLYVCQTDMVSYALGSLSIRHIISYAVSSVSIRQTLFPIQCFLCASDRHCFVYTNFYVCQADTVSYALGSVSIRHIV